MTHPALWVLLGLVLAPGMPWAGDRAAGQATGEDSSIRGWVVVHETGIPMEGVGLTLTGLGDLSAEGSILSGTGGFFHFPSVPPGVYQLSAALMGYTTFTDTLNIVADVELEVTVPLSVEPVPLEPMVVVVRRRPVGPLEDFERRRITQRGLFLDKDEIDDTNAQEFTDLVRTVPGVRLVPTATLGGSRLYFRGGCTPDLWVDGAQVGSLVDIDAFLRVDDLEAVEVYRGPDLPGEFGTNLCGAIVAWTLRGRDPRRGEHDTSLKRQLLIAGSLALTFFGIYSIGH